MRILNGDVLTNHGNVEGRKKVASILEAGLCAADPFNNICDMLKIEGDILYVGKEQYEPFGTPVTGAEKIDLSQIDRIFVFAIGKGIVRAAQALEAVLQERITDGYVLCKHDDLGELKYLKLAYGGHPVPDQSGCDSCRNIVNMIREANLTERDLVFTIVGNGVSSLLTLPPDEIALEEVQDITRILQQEKGISTREVNYVRNQVDVLKSGRFTRLLAPAKMIHLITIDINEPEIDGSFGYDGLMHHNFWLHTMPDYTTPELAISILKENDAWESMSDSVRTYLEERRGTPSLTAEEFEALNCRIFGVMPNEIGVLPTAMKKAEELGYTPHLMARRTFVEASTMGTFVSRMAILSAEENTPFECPCAMIIGGEQLVTVGKNPGIGGRNQEFVLASALAIAGNEQITVGAVDTDGTDGPGGMFDEDAAAKGCKILAGGIADGLTVAESQDRDVDIAAALRTHSASTALWKLDSGVWAIPSISLQDLIVILIDAKVQ